MTGENDPDWVSPSLVEALRASRLAVDDRRRARAAQGHQVGEVEQTQELLINAFPRVEYAEFNQQQEGAVGADWLWWFLGRTGECFGLLVQAKMLRGSAGMWELDLSYPKGTRRQMDALLTVADEFDVPAAYVAFFGGAHERPDLECGSHSVPVCSRCERSSVAILSGLAALAIVRLDEPYRPHDVAPDAFRQSVPIEDLASAASQEIFDVNWNSLSLELKQFLSEPQTGPAAVAKHMFEVAAAIRRGQFSAAIAEMAPPVSDYVFAGLPTDNGHGGPPYWVHTLRGLRRQPPEYVAALLEGDARPELTPGIRGVAVFHMD